MILREYQENIVDQALAMLYNRRVVYMAMEMRTGKTLTSLVIAKELGVESVLFVTKLKAIEGIQSDADLVSLDGLEIVNYESLHKCKKEYDLVICDEVHTVSAYPRPSLGCTRLRDIKKNYTILMSGTPMPESASQLYHQFYISKENSPFKDFTNFYKWAGSFVNVQKKRISNQITVNDYSDANLEKINLFIDPVIIRFTQEDAGFSTDNFNIKEHTVKIPDKIMAILSRLKRDKVVVGKSGTILADTGVKMMSKEHQLTSGTVILEDGKGIIVDDFKGKYIFDNFKDQKAVIFYKYQAEREILEKYKCDEWKLLQLQSGSTGLTLKQYDCIVYMNLDFSCVTFTQSIERLNFLGRESNDIHIILSPNGIDRNILKVLREKKDFSIKIYESIS